MRFPRVSWSEMKNYSSLKRKCVRAQENKQISNFRDMRTIFQNIKTAVKAYFSRKREVRAAFLRSRRQEAAENDIQVKEYNSALWLACKGVPLVPVQTIGTEETLYATLKLARENYIECELKEVIK